ncbi:MAG: hypothetical protein IJZ36_03645 [Bacilli bacterium]|nr:hypothetical protein [Bacilli bacterium]
MKKIFILFILIIICFLVLTNSNDILSSSIFSFNIWKNNIFPSLFPFFIISQLLINYGFVEVLSELFKPLMNFFNLNKNCAFIFIMSMLSGFPTNAKYTKELYDNNLINEYEASKILAFTSFSNPLFIIGTVSVVFLNNSYMAPLILFSHYFPNFIIALMLRNYYPSKCDKSKIDIIGTLKNVKVRNDNFGLVLTNAIKNAIETLLSILGIITIYLIFTTLLSTSFNLNDFLLSLLSGFIEMTQGLKYVSILNISLKFKTILSCMILSFGGLSVHMQVLSIISDTKIKFLPFFTCRIIHSLLSGIISYILFDFII